ncbi:MAG: phosphotransferase [Oscillatoriaceae cyanobacterium Prado104]|jgi:aminoglycoside phosphotransferase (APT) family kinase protein|nr:phosphotransferase [Oscillatoriaceae cyanobacterium Prado104]
MLGIPPPEIEIDTLLVSRLLAEQHPDLQHLPLQFIDAGWDNAMFRWGDRWAVRLPRRAIAARLLENELFWLPQLARQLPIPIPTPCKIGIPSVIYPWHWSVIPWLPGQTADRANLDREQPQRFARFLKALHVPAPDNAPINPFRGVPLSQRSQMVEERMQRLERQTNAIEPAIRSLWQEAVGAPIDVEPTWLHGEARV